MSRKVALGGVIVSCDFAYDPERLYPGELRHCVEEFRSASVKTIIAKQLEVHGWSHRVIGAGLYRKNQDFCPMHTERMRAGRGMPFVRDKSQDTAP